MSKKTVKIISVDNFDEERLGTSDDELVADHVDAYYADTLVAALISVYCATDHSPRFFKVVPDDYKLRRYEP